MRNHTKKWAVTFTARLTLTGHEIHDLAETVRWRNAEVVYLGESETVKVTAKLAAADATTAMLDITAAVGAWMNLYFKQLGHVTVEAERVGPREELASRLAVGPTPNLPEVLKQTRGSDRIRIVNAGEPLLVDELVDALPADVEDGCGLGVGATFPVVTNR